jgi:aquaporin NIP
MKRYAAEFFASFLMIFLGTGSMVLSDQSGGWFTHLHVALSWGFAVGVSIFLFGRHSAHMNPAVTISMTMLKAHPKRDLLTFLGLQFGGGIAASVLLVFLAPDHEFLGSSLPSGGAIQSFYIEFLLTFALMTVVLFAGWFRKGAILLVPLAIGGTVCLEAYFAGPTTGASMNPARSFAPAIISGHTEHLWVYLIATTLGAMSAGGLWLFLPRFYQRRKLWYRYQRRRIIWRKRKP